MDNKIKTIEAYMESLDEKRRPMIAALRDVMRRHLPDGVEEGMANGMIGYAIPHERYPAGYHVNPEEPLPFFALANQKQYVSVYHMALGLFPEVEEWYREIYRERFGKKPNMGKSCLRFKAVDEKVLSLIGELCEQVSVAAYIEAYERVITKK